MNEEGKALEKQLGLWTLLGPFIMLITLTILLIHPTNQSLLMPIIGLAAIPLCWIYKLRGLIPALACVLLAFLFQLTHSAPERIFWDLLLAGATALTLAITALCCLEVEDLFCHMHKESSTRLQDFLGVNAKLQQLEEQREHEAALAKSQVELLRRQLSDETALLQASEKNAQQLTEKMANVSTQNETLLRELFQKRYECDKLSQQSQCRDKELEALLATNKQLECQVQEQAEKAAAIQAQLDMNQREREQSQHAAKEFAAASDAKETLLIEQICQLELQLEQLKQGQASWQQMENKYLAEIETLQKQCAETSTADPIEAKEPSQAPSKAKSKGGKPSKTNNWANAILSRWSESHDHPQ